MNDSSNIKSALVDMLLASGRSEIRETKLEISGWLISCGINNIRLGDNGVFYAPYIPSTETMIIK